MHIKIRTYNIANIPQAVEWDFSEVIYGILESIRKKKLTYKF